MLLKLAWENVRKSVRDFAVYFVTVALGVAVFFAFNSIADQQVVAEIGREDSMRELLSMLISYVSVFVGIVLAFLVIYANRFLIGRRSREFGLYLLLGMRTSQVLGVVAAETIIAGAASLAAGLVAGFALSQALFQVAALFFQGATAGFAAGLSTDALVLTLVVFSLMFAVAAVANAVRVSRTRLAELMSAHRANEAIRLRSLPLSAVLFVVACAIIGLSYHLLVENGLMAVNGQFAAATALVCVGTWLAFYSLSGFLLRVVQLVRPLYLRGLNAFTLRQLAAKMNTVTASMTVVCMVLFLSITSVCGGIGMMDSISSTVGRSTSYDASVTTRWLGYSSETGNMRPLALEEERAFAAEHGFDMREGMAAGARALGEDGFEAMVAQSAQVDSHVDADAPLTFGAVEDAAGCRLVDFVNSSNSVNEIYRSFPVCTMKLSQVNAALELAGAEPIELGAGECAVVYDADYADRFWQQVAERCPVVEADGALFRVVRALNVYLYTSTFPSNTGHLVVRDDELPAGMSLDESILDLRLAAGADAGEFQRIIDAMVVRGDASDDFAPEPAPVTWPVYQAFTRGFVYEQSTGLTGIIAFLAVYIGFALTVACAAILAIQQLAQARESSRRYGLLRKLGAPERMVSASLFTQVALYFLAPLALALSHTACALQVVADVIAAFGQMNITDVALTTAAAFLVTYGAYLLATYALARRAC